MGTGIRWCTREWGCSGYLGRLSIEFGPSERGYMNKAHSFDDEERDGMTQVATPEIGSAFATLVPRACYIEVFMYRVRGRRRACVWQFDCVGVILRFSLSPLFFFSLVSVRFRFEWRAWTNWRRRRFFGRVEYIGWQCWEEIFA